MTAPLSSPDPTGPHPDPDELADLAEGLVESAATAGALRRHLDGCAECRETADALAEVQALLGAVEPPPMPADLAGRLDSALAAAAAEAVEGPQEAAAADDGAGPPARPSRPATAPSTAPAPPLAPPPGRPSAATAPAGPGATGAGRSRPRRRRAGLLLGSAAALLAIGLGGVLLLRPADRQSVDGTMAKADAPAAAAATTDGRAEHAAGGTVYRDDRLTAQIQQLLARTAATPAPPAAKPSVPSGPADGTPADGPPADGTQGLGGGGRSAPACPAPADGPPLATDRGSYAGAPVEVLVYPVPDRSGLLDVYLRSPGCGPVLLHRTVPAR
ncbi:hypothetical protein [Kitasatospora sp. NPDC088548]|uniref:hypothetical protein n=1 Tax=Kitasatospora sp. NPDC088548 TaxID=3364075 RepID=UPI00382669D3